MNNFAKLTLLAALAAGLLSTSVSAQDANSSRQGRPPINPPVFKVNRVPPAAVKHVGNGAYINSGVYGTTILAATFTPINAAITVTCPGSTGTCLLQADQWIQTGLGTTTFNEFAICLYVDGVNTGNCWYNGSTPSDTSFVIGTTSSGKTITHGNHVVQSIVYSNNGAFMSYYNFTYKIFKP